MKKIIIVINLGLLSLAHLLAPLTVQAADESCTWRQSYTYFNQATEAMVKVGGCAQGEDTGYDCAGDNPDSNKYICCCKKAAANLITPTEEKPTFILPEFQVSIPTVALTESNKLNFETNPDGSYRVDVPWIGQYVAGVYKYGLGIAGILAAIILMAAGVLWLVSGGDVSKVSQAKELIIGSITGLVILSSSYIILTQINPDLVVFKSISLGTVAPTGFDTPDAGETEIGTGINPYEAGCIAARQGDWSVCRGYGDKRPEGLVVLDSVYADAGLAEKYQAVRDCVKEKNGGNFPFYILVGWRGALDQIRMKEEWTAKGQPGNAATPCCSNHGSGRALDLRIGTPANWSPMSWNFNNSSHLTECMNANGLYATVGTEPWHWSLTGK